MPEILVNLNTLHKAQQQIVREAKRFNVLKCGRQFGKTDLSKELVIQPILDGKFIGYWYPTYKDGDKTWAEIKYALHDLISEKNEQLKKLKLITGGTLDMWSMDDPDSGRGFAYHRVIVDEAEKAKKLKEAWEQAIRATLLFYKGDAWFLSTPKFGQTYFKKVLFTNEQTSDQWKSWRFTSFDNPHLDPLEIQEAQKLDELTFRCEYLAEDVDITANPFAYAFNAEKHIGECKFNPLHELMVSFDFNVDPITALTCQYYDDTIYFIKEFRLSNSDIYALCDQIKAYFPNALLVITGDATGQSRSAITKGNFNYYTVIQQTLGLTPHQMKLPTVNPAISDTRILMNSILQNMNVLIDPVNCEYFIKDLKYAEVDNEGELKKDRQRTERYLDLLDCGRYMLSTFFDWFLKLK